MYVLLKRLGTTDLNILVLVKLMSIKTPLYDPVKLQNGSYMTEIKPVKLSKH